MNLWSQWVYPILLFIAGLGGVVFFHELGHFLVAKRVGIKVERFALGFGPRLFGIKRGETDYCIMLLPLGGYIKMLGQDDLKPVKEGGDPRAFNNKSIGARLAVISAGVAMNVVLAGILFPLVAMMGKEFPSPIIGEVAPGFPASQALVTLENGPDDEPARGLKPGDTVVRIHGDSAVLNWIGGNVTRFSDLFMTSAFADRDDKFTFTFKRSVGGRELTGTTRVGVAPSGGGTLVFGISPAADLVFGEPEEYVTDSPYRKRDKLIAVDGRKLEHHREIESIEKSLTGRPVTVTVRRDDRDHDITASPKLQLEPNFVWMKDGSRLRGDIFDVSEDGAVTLVQEDGTKRKIERDQIAGGRLDVSLDILGLIPRMKILAVSKGSPAEKAEIIPGEKAGLKPGDIVVGYGDHDAPTFRKFRDINKEITASQVDIAVLRGDERITFRIKPVRKGGQVLVGILHESDLAHPVVAGVREGSPAAKEGIVCGTVITRINGQPVDEWLDIYRILKDRLDQKVAISYRIGSNEKVFEIDKLDKAVFDPQDYKFALFAGDVVFEPLLVTVRQRNPLLALAWGGEETLKMIVSTYLGLRSLIRGTVSTKGVMGPIGIGSIAIQTGRKSFIDFVYFMAYLSAILAVMNFLPIPVVDGGHVVFLVIEKIRRRPLSMKIQYATQVVGLVLLLGLFLAITWQDIARIMSNSW